jgi:diguanylate cyclase (GGDEF)-like protein
VTGPRAEERRAIRVRLGDGVAGGVLQRGLPLIVGTQASEAVYSPASANRLYKTASFISFPIILGGRRVGVLNVTDKHDGAAYDELDLGLLRMITPQLVLALDSAGWQQKATRFQLLSITDPLTDLLNRRYLEERLGEEIERSKRSRIPMSFMMIDIDDFKFYNDRSGHQAGDLALEMTAQNLKSALRTADVAARYGGEEFCVLLPGTNIEEAYTVAQRIRRRVERTRYPHGAKQPLGCVTVSIGISTFAPDTASPAAMISAADQLLYMAKRLGKNRVEPQI